MSDPGPTDAEVAEAARRVDDGYWYRGPYNVLLRALLRDVKNLQERVAELEARK